MLGVPMLANLNLLTWLRAQCKGRMLPSWKGDGQQALARHPTQGRGTQCASSPPTYTEHLFEVYLKSFQRPYFRTLFLKSKTKLPYQEQKIHLPLYSR